MGISGKTGKTEITENGKEVSEEKREASGHLFTQSEVDKLIGERLKRERSLNAGLSEMKEVITQLQSCGILNATSRAGAASELANRLQAMLAENGKQAAVKNDAENADGTESAALSLETSSRTEKDPEHDPAGNNDGGGDGAALSDGDPGGFSDAEEKSDAEDGGKKTDSMPYGGFFDAKSRAGAMGLFASGASGAYGASEIGEISEDSGASPFGIGREELCGLYAESMAEAKEAEKPEEAAEPDGDENALVPDAEGLRELLLSAARAGTVPEAWTEDGEDGEDGETGKTDAGDTQNEKGEKDKKDGMVRDGGTGDDAFGGRDELAGTQNDIAEFLERFPDADPARVFADKGFRSFAKREAEKGRSLAELYGEYTELLHSIAELRAQTESPSQADAEKTENGRDGGRHSGIFSTGFSAGGASASAYLADSLTASQREIARLAGLSLREYAEMLRDIPGKEVLSRRER